MTNKTYFQIINKDRECITDGFDRDAVILAATKYFETIMCEEGREGEDEEELTLISENEDGVTTEEKLMLYPSYEDDFYDGGRADYYAAQMGV